MKVTIFVFLFFFSGFVRAASIEDAQGLPDEEPTIELSSDFSNIRHRSYILIESVQRKRERTKQHEFPNAEASTSVDYHLAQRTDFFVDGLVTFHDSNDETRLFINQAGLRQRWADNYSIAFGKERSRRSPGIFISPSDLIFTQSQLPGQREDRRGVWSLRASFQKMKSSYDLFLLPVDKMNPQGFPDKKAKYAGTVLRTFHQFEELDMSASFGEFNGILRAGLSAQTIFRNTWKHYYEFGYSHKQNRIDGSEKKNLSQQLLGTSYEGSNDYSVKLEYFYNGFGLNPAEFDTLKQKILALPVLSNVELLSTPFIRQHFTILTASAPDIFDRYNLITAVIKSLAWASLMRSLRESALNPPKTTV